MVNILDLVYWCYILINNYIDLVWNILYFNDFFNDFDSLVVRGVKY